MGDINEVRKQHQYTNASLHSSEYISHTNKHHYVYEHITE